MFSFSTKFLTRNPFDHWYYHCENLSYRLPKERPVKDTSFLFCVCVSIRTSDKISEIILKRLQIYSKNQLHKQKIVGLQLKYINMNLNCHSVIYFATFNINLHCLGQPKRPLNKLTFLCTGTFEVVSSMDKFLQSLFQLLFSTTKVFYFKFKSCFEFDKNVQMYKWNMGWIRLHYIGYDWNMSYTTMMHVLTAVVTGRFWRLFMERMSMSRQFIKYVVIAVMPME